MVLVKNYVLELKNRFLCFFFTAFFSFIVSYNYKEILLFFIAVKPIVSIKNTEFFLFYFIFTNLIEIFIVYVKLTYFVVFQIMFFYTAYHFFIFLNSAFYKKEYNFFFYFFTVIMFTWFFSFIFARFFIIPLCWNFILNYKNFFSFNFFSLHLEPKLSEYFSFCIHIYFICFFCCQIFSFIIIILSYRKIKLIIVKKYRKHFYFILTLCFNIFFTTFEVISQIMLNLILFSIFEFIIVFFVFKNCNIKVNN